MVKKRTREILALLDEAYGRELICYLNHRNAQELLFATILSAQCTDERVNLVTKELFEKYPTVEAFAHADQRELEEQIRPVGFFRSKAKNIIACARQLLEKHDGKVPESLEELTSLAGVGRKTANVIRGNIFHEPYANINNRGRLVSSVGRAGD